MGLDSVELIMETEKYFGIVIPDAEAEKIYTIKEMVECVARHRMIKSEGTQFKNYFLLKVISSLPEAEFKKQSIKCSDIASDHISPFNRNEWSTFELNMNLKIPKPNARNPYPIKWSEKLKNLIRWNSNYDWNVLTIQEFADAIAATNYQQLLESNKIMSKYEIYIAVIGLTVDKVGIDVYEVTPDKLFTDDLGID